MLVSIFTKSLTIASVIALQVARTSFVFQLRECMGNCFPLPYSLSLIFSWLQPSTAVFAVVVCSCKSHGNPFGLEPSY